MITREFYNHINIAHAAAAISRKRKQENKRHTYYHTNKNFELLIIKGMKPVSH